ncbi:MAG TPA: hypothetical protein VFN26_18560 [Candidatus Acidoferrum sp.]|nr:hypothetical protein [Candidatus Acidoferrum sp.]
MPNWNQILGWDDFKNQTASFDYYRDIFLTWPFLGFSIGAISVLIAPQSPAYRIFGLKLAMCAVVALLLAKERLLLVLVASAYVAIRMSIGIIFSHTWVTLALLLVSSGTLVVVFRSGVLKDRKLSYVIPKKSPALGIAIGVLGLGVMMAIGFWMKP